MPVISKNDRYAGTIKPMTTQNPEEVVNALFDAFEARDFERVRSFLSDDDFSYRSPIESFSNADDFIVTISRVVRYSSELNAARPSSMVMMFAAS